MSKIRSVAAAMVAICSAVAFAGPDWQEGRLTGIDAGSFVNSAEITLGVGQINTISGTLQGLSAFGDGDFEDMYIIRVAEPTTFFFEVQNASFDSALYLFNITQANEAFGLLAADDTVDFPGTRLVGSSTDGSLAQLTNPGVYALAITFAGNVPVSRSGDIFSFTTPTEISGPDGPGGINPHNGWDRKVEFSGGDYEVMMDGIDFVDVPAPGALGLAVGLLGLRRRR